MRHDLHQLDRELVALRDDRRQALALVEAGGETPPSPFASRLFHLHDELRESDEPVAQAIAAWLDVMRVEERGWADRLLVEQLWNTEHRVAGLDEPISLRGLREKVLRVPHEGLRSAYADGLTAVCGEASSRSVSALVLRLETEGRAYWAVDGEDMAVRVAEQVLDATADVALEAATGLLASARTAIGALAAEGWPARLTQRWLSSVFGGARLGEGLDVRLPPLPPVWGALSFSRALGELGTAVLDAARPKHMPFSLHKRPRGHRRHARRALFAAVVLERPFARTVLGLGADRVREHRRHVARALCLSLRCDALRVLVTAALASGEGAGRDTFSELTDRHFGQAAPVVLLGVLPRLRPADGPALVGAVTAFAHRHQLVDNHDEDWFRNPRALDAIRHEDEAVAPPAPNDATLELAITSLTRLVEDAAS